MMSTREKERVNGLGPTTRLARTRRGATNREICIELPNTIPMLRSILPLAAMARAEGGFLSHVKPHGALYNTIAHDERQARDVITAILEQ